jgi:hypothetical protein
MVSDMVKFTRLTTRIPSWLVSAVEETPIQRIYEMIRLSYGEFEWITVESQCGEFQLLVPTSSYIYTANTEYTDGYEPALRSRLSAVLSPKDVFYDIGAAFGYFSSLAVACGVSPAKIHCFEVDWFRCQVLQRTHQTEQLHICERFVGDGYGDSIALDNYSDEAEWPTVVKMDVEGKEVAAIDGMQEVIKMATPHLFIECHPTKVSGGPAALSELAESLQAHGYDIRHSEHREATADPVDDLPMSGTYLLEAIPMSKE